MSDSSKKSNWDELAELLGPEIPHEPPAPPVVQQPPAPAAPPPTPGPPKVVKSDWTALASELGLPPSEAPPEAPPDSSAQEDLSSVSESPASPSWSSDQGPSVEPPSERSSLGSSTPEADSAADTVPRDALESPAPKSPAFDAPDDTASLEQPFAAGLTQEAHDLSDEIASPDLGFDEESATEIDSELELAADSADRDAFEDAPNEEPAAPPPRRRRRRRRGRSRAAPSSDGATERDSDSVPAAQQEKLSPAMDDPFALSEDLDGAADATEDVLPQRDAPNSRQRESFQKKDLPPQRSKSPAAVDAALEDEDTELEPDELESELDEESTSDDDDSRGTSRRAGHRNIPSWQEAVSVIVSNNMASRTTAAKSRGPSRGRGRGRSRRK